MCVKYNNKRVLDYLREFDTQLYEEIKEKGSASIKKRVSEFIGKQNSWMDEFENLKIIWGDISEDYTLSK